VRRFEATREPCPGKFAGAAAAQTAPAGVTLIELVVVVAVLLLVLGGALTVVFNSQISFALQMEEAVIEQNGRQVSERLTREIQEAFPASVLPIIMANSSFVSFQKVVGFENGIVQLGPLITLGFEPETGEQVNGRDDNRDGRVDEGYVTFTEFGRPAIRLVGDVLSLRFNPATNGISYAVEIGRVDREGQVTRRTYQQGAAFRNP
jgi:prepilin-type N-terminal cleavage/methylation domain-containing protein